MVIISSCSSTKHVPVDLQLTASAIRARRLAPFAKEWARRVRAAAPVSSAAHLYGGPGVAAALTAARRLDCPAYFVSAGLSLVSSRRQVPSYDLSVSYAASCPPAVAKGDASPADWWDALNRELGRAQPIATLVRRSDAPVLVALPGPYISMVADDLLALTAYQRSKLRLIVAGNTRVPHELDAFVVRYDDRLAGLGTAPAGANSYFAQRALGHFAKLMARHARPDADVTTHRRWVQAALAKAKPVAVPERTPQTDAAITRWIKRADPPALQSVTALLRSFRDGGFACEQSRFRRLVERTRRHA